MAHRARLRASVPPVSPAQAETRTRAAQLSRALESRPATARTLLPKAAPPARRRRFPSAAARPLEPAQGRSRSEAPATEVTRMCRSPTFGDRRWAELRPADLLRLLSVTVTRNLAADPRVAPQSFSESRRPAGCCASVMLCLRVASAEPSLTATPALAKRDHETRDDDCLD